MQTFVANLNAIVPEMFGTAAWWTIYASHPRSR